MNTLVLNAPLTISDITIRQDDQGRYCLNDLHKAAGNETRHKPSEWLRNKQTTELIEEVEKAGITAIQSKQQLGTFVLKPLVYAYAMWISAKFHIAVIRAYDALVTGQIPYALKSLPLKKTKIAVEGGLSLATQDELKNMIHDLAATLLRRFFDGLTTPLVWAYALRRVLKSSPTSGHPHPTDHAVFLCLSFFQCAFFAHSRFAVGVATNRLNSCRSTCWLFSSSYRFLFGSF